MGGGGGGGEGGGEGGEKNYLIVSFVFLSSKSSVL